MTRISQSPTSKRWIPPGKPRLLLFLVLSFLGAFVWSFIHPRDRFVWFLEVVPAIAGFVILAATYRRFRFSSLVYVLMWLHALVLLFGGHYTHAGCPFSTGCAISTA